MMRIEHSPRWSKRHCEQVESLSEALGFVVCGAYIQGDLLCRKKSCSDNGRCAQHGGRATGPCDPEVSRRNGRLSRGPVTRAGKNRSRLNGFRYGFHATTTKYKPCAVCTYKKHCKLYRSGGDCLREQVGEKVFEQHMLSYPFLKKSPLMTGLIRQLAQLELVDDRIGHLLGNLRDSDVRVFETIWRRKLALYDRLAKMEENERRKE
ncbi:MAG: HGGxSTG domain-containing protein [Planctomycetota bacterium]|jgi:hypothetical protein